MCDEAIYDKRLAYTADSLYSPCRPGTALNDVHTFSYLVFQQPYQQRWSLSSFYTWGGRHPEGLSHLPQVMHLRGSEMHTEVWLPSTSSHTAGKRLLWSHSSAPSSESPEHFPQLTCELALLLDESVSKSSIFLKLLQYKDNTCAFSVFPGLGLVPSRMLSTVGSECYRIIWCGALGCWLRSLGKECLGATRKGRALTPGAVAMAVHEGEAQALIFLQGALVREAPVYGTHHVGLLLAVVDRGLGHVHWFPAEEGWWETWVLSWAGQQPEVNGEAWQSGGLEARSQSRSISGCWGGSASILCPPDPVSCCLPQEGLGRVPVLGTFADSKGWNSSGLRLGSAS